jgi:hypothetical protein
MGHIVRSADRDLHAAQAAYRAGDEKTALQILAKSAHVYQRSAGGWQVRPWVRSLPG